MQYFGWDMIDFMFMMVECKLLPCSVRDHVFQDFNETQSDKVYAGVNSAFGEVFGFILQKQTNGSQWWHR